MNSSWCCLQFYMKFMLHDCRHTPTITNQPKVSGFIKTPTSDLIVVFVFSDEMFYMLRPARATFDTVYKIKMSNDSGQIPRAFRLYTATCNIRLDTLQMKPRLFTNVTKFNSKQRRTHWFENQIANCFSWNLHSSYSVIIEMRHIENGKALPFMMDLC